MKETLLKIIDMLKALVAGLNPVKKSPEEPKYCRNHRLLVFASNEIGVKEVAGSGNNQQIVKYHSFAREDNDLSKGLADSVPWCASFICYCLEMVGMGSTNKMNARSFLNWGKSFKKKPLPGDIVVYWRGSVKGWQGHVGIFLKKVDGYIYTLGGNQSDAVNVSKYIESKMLDIRRSSRMKTLTSEEISALHSLADNIIQGNKINLDGKVV